MKEKQQILDIWKYAIGGAIYNTLIKAAKELEHSKIERIPYNDEE